MAKKIIREECEGCHIAVPSEEELDLIEYRGHRLCGWCVRKWRELDKKLGRQTNWQEFTKQSKTKKG